MSDRLEESVSLWRRFLGIDAGEVQEVVGFVRGRPWVGYARSEAEQVRLLRMAEGQQGAAGAYLLLNPIDPVIAERYAPGYFGPAHSGRASDKEVPLRRAVYIDVDPVRPKGISATDSQRADALVVATEIRHMLTGHCGADAVAFGSSGNGWYLLVAIEPVLVAADQAQGIKRLLDGLQRRYGSDSVSIDGTVHNPARLMPAPGTWKRKGAGSKQRPHRQTTFECEETPSRVPLELLLSLTDTPQEPARALPAVRPDDPFAAVHRIPILDVLAWLGVETAQRGSRTIVRCPRCGAFDDTSSAVVGNAVKCLHQTCSDAGPASAPGLRSAIDLTMLVRGLAKPFDAVRDIADAFCIPIAPRRPAPPSLRLVTGEGGGGGIDAMPPVATAGPALDLMLDGNSRIVANLHNATVLVAHALSDLAQNDFSGRVVLRTSNAEWDDIRTTNLTATLEREWGWRGSHSLVSRAVNAVAASRSWNPLQAMLSGLQWDGRERLTTWLPRLCGTVDDPYTRAISRAWLISAVKRAFTPGAQVDCVLVLLGPQGARKSSLLRAFGGDYFTDQLPSMSNGRDFEEALMGVWIAELSELDHLTRSELSTIKAAVSRRVGRARLAYAERATDMPRTCVFAGTSNEETFLADPTGDRRWWPVTVGRIDLTLAEGERDQLLAEATQAMRADEQWWLTGHAEDLARHEQASRYRADDWETIVLRYCSGRDWVRTLDICRDALDLPIGKVSRSDQMRVAQALTRIGGRRVRRRIGDVLVWGYEPSVGGWGASLLAPAACPVEPAPPQAPPEDDDRGPEPRQEDIGTWATQWR